MTKEINSGNIRLYIEDSYDDMSARAADVFCRVLKSKPHGVYGFATGGTPVGLYRELIKLYQRDEIDFSNITTFNLDEYYPIKKDNDQSYDYFMKMNLFNHVNVKGGNLNIPNGEAVNPNEECIRYEEKIMNAGGIDLQILGIGENGHIGFNEPSDRFTRATNHVALTESTISANARFFASMADVPKHALTMGIKTIMQAGKILLLGNSEKKSWILNRALFGDISPEVPASALQLHPDVTVVMDNAAAGSLRNCL